jgi:hypothetical protein
VRASVGLAAAALTLAACAAGPRVVPLPAAGTRVEADGSVAAEAAGVRLVVRPSAWHGTPASLPAYVTPFHLLLVNGSAAPLAYQYADLRLFDEARFQYTALPPVDVVRLLGSFGAAPAPPVLVASAGRIAGQFNRRVWGWDPWWWGPPGWPLYGPYMAPRYDDVLLQALPVGTLDPGARLEGFVYFPRLRPDARRLVLEFHHQLGGIPGVLSLPFAVERASGPPVPAG